MKIEGKVFKYGDNIDTDQIYPGRYLELTEPEAIAEHALEGIDPEFSEKVEPGDIIVGGKNFGCGSSREHAVICLKEKEIGAVIAESFARIFFRNSINTGLPIVECPEAAKDAETGDEFEVNVEEGTVRNLSRDKTYTFPPFPEEIGKIIDAGGLINYASRHLKSVST